MHHPPHRPVWVLRAWAGFARDGAAHSSCVMPAYAMGQGAVPVKACSCLPDLSHAHSAGTSSAMAPQLKQGTSCYLKKLPPEYWPNLRPRSPKFDFQVAAGAARARPPPACMTTVTSSPDTRKCRCGMGALHLELVGRANALHHSAFGRHHGLVHPAARCSH